MVLEQAANTYMKTVEGFLGQEDGGIIDSFEGLFDKTAFGDKEIYDLLIPQAERDEAAALEAERQGAYMPRAFPRAKSNAGNAEKVDKLIKVALARCAASEEAVNDVAANIDRILVSGNGTLRTLEEVRERSLAIAASHQGLRI